MTFNQAFKIALNNEEFKKHVDKVKTNLEAGEDSGCLLFAINDEAFSYGSDFVGEIKVKHNAFRSHYLIEHGKCLIIE